MARATEQEVIDILDTTLENEDVTPFLSAANLLVTDVCGNEGYSDNLMREIERWLAAHFLAIRDPRISKQKIGDADATYEGKTGLGLNHTSYGQQAMILDHHGKLAEVSEAKMPAELKVLG